MIANRYFLPDPKIAMTDETIVQEIEHASRVIDLGCGDGHLLGQLRDKHGCSIQGIELESGQIREAIARGIPVVQSDLDRGLPDIPDNCFDVAVLSQTLQQVRRPKRVLTEMLRIANRALVVVPNFGYWRIRLQVLLHGRAPVTDALPYEWYDTPNLHVLSMHDFRDLAEQLNIHILKELPIIRDRAVEHAWVANWRAHSALYVLERGQRPT